MKTWKSGHMNRIYASIEDLVGSTPLFEPVRVEKQLHLTSHLLCKLEGLNPAGSIKDRAALSMLQAAEADGTLSPGDTIVEQTSGNTGIALASMAIPRGYHCEIFLESGVTPERRTILRALGCRLLDYRDVPGAADPDAPFDPFREATLEEIRRYCTAMGPSFHFLDQTSNPANPQAHIRSTGPEI
jgi:cysteine synthase A